MRTHLWGAIPWLGLTLLTPGCRSDAGMGPGPESYRLTRDSTAQCLASLAGPALQPGFVRSRVASLLGGRAEAVCLSREGGRWLLRPIAAAEIRPIEAGAVP
jgi:hypothetical protein